MARPKRVPGIDPDKRIAPNARRIFRVRIEEVYAFEPFIADPANVTELHDIRIALKRLRYLLEIFDVGFEADLTTHLEQVKELQDLLGDIHDCDVQIPMLVEHLGWLDTAEARAIAALAGQQAANGRPESIDEAYAAFKESLDGTRRSDERVGIHALIARRRRERDELHGEFLSVWRRMKQERFRASLEAALEVSS